jgi:hypothetical protein
MRLTEEMPAPPRQIVSWYTVCVDVHFFVRTIYDLVIDCTMMLGDYK